VEYFCVAKPQKGDLQTVEGTKCTMLERLGTPSMGVYLWGESPL
jgi:hypothetical protein